MTAATSRQTLYAFMSWTGTFQFQKITTYFTIKINTFETNDSSFYMCLCFMDGTAAEQIAVSVSVYCRKQISTCTLHAQSAYTSCA